MRVRTAALLLMVAAATSMAAGADVAVAWPADAWESMYADPGAEATRLDGEDAVRFRCAFEGTDHPRASWDCAVSLDLTQARGLAFTFASEDVLPVARFSLYLHSGDGWYSGYFTPELSGETERIVVPRLDMRTEDRVRGWKKIDRIRISAWRGMDQNTSFSIADLSVVPVTPGVAVLRPETAEAKGAGATADDTARRISSYLDEWGLDHALVSDLDLSVTTLKPHRLLIAPYAPKLDGAATTAIQDFVKAGGKLVTFFTIPPALRELHGLRQTGYQSAEPQGRFAAIRPADAPLLPDVPATVRQHSWNIIGMAPAADTTQVAAWWYDDAGTNTGEAAVLLSACGAHMTHILLDDDREAQSRLLLAMVQYCWPEAGRMAERHAKESLLRLARDLRQPEPDEASLNSLDAMAKAREALLASYYRAQQPAAGEFRGFWCHDAFGVPGMTWDALVKMLSENGFTAVFPNVAWGGLAYYESEVLPVAPEVATRGDQLALCLAACRKYGLACHPWKVCWNMTDHAPRDFRERMRREGRLQVTAQGEVRASWLCPCHPANQELEVAAMVEMGTRCAVDGVHFDYIRYPDEASSFGPDCRGRFEAAHGAPVADWPADVRRGGSLERAWQDFRRDQITHVVRRVRAELRERNSSAQVSAAVFTTWPRHRDTVAQDWSAWCRAGLLDFVCPMDYTASTPQFETWVHQQTTWAHGVPVYPGIGLSLWEEPAPMRKFIEQVRATRALGTDGFMVFNLDQSALREVVRWCGQGLLAKP